MNSGTLTELSEERYSFNTTMSRSCQGPGLIIRRVDYYQHGKPHLNGDDEYSKCCQIQKVEVIV